MSSIDLSTPPAGHEFKVNIDRSETPGERSVRLFKELALFVLAVAFVILIAWLCLDTLRSAGAGPDEKRWAMSVLSAATGGIVGYLVRK